MSVFERIADKARDIFLGGPNDWTERLQASLEMTAPDGSSWSAKWRGDPRQHTKKLAVFSYPKVRGNVIQDLSVESTEWKLTFFFDGPDNDLTASRFFEATKLDGTWTVIHPVHGFVELQLVDIREVDDPVESGNITLFESSWLEPIDPDLLASARELAGVVDSQVDSLNDSALQQFADRVSTVSETVRNGIDRGVNGVENISDALLDPIAQITDEVAATQLAIHDAIRDTMNATVLRTRSLAGQIQALFQNPALVPRDAKEQASTYNDVVDSLSAGLTTTTDAANLNATLVTELAMSAALGGLAQAVVNNIASVTTRAQAVTLAATVRDVTDSITAALDLAQSRFEAVSFIGDQYFAQSQSYTDLLLLSALLQQYILTGAPSLAVERRFTLTEPSAPISIVLREYGDAERLGFFVETNGLTGDEIYMLPAGREVVTYA